MVVNFGELQKNVEHNQGGSSKETERTRLQAPPIMYIPADEENYYIQLGNYLRLCCQFCTADLTGIRVPTRQDDGSYKDAAGDVMLREDMADYFARLRAAHAPPPPAAPAPAPPVAAVIAEPPAHTGPIRSGPASTGKAKRQRQMTLI